MRHRRLATTATHMCTATESGSATAPVRADGGTAATSEASASAAMIMSLCVSAAGDHER
jgi:hypothetical protein